MNKILGIIAVIFLCSVFTFSNQKAYWAEPPLLVNCQDSPFTIEEVELIANKWEARGHHFFGVVQSSLCPDYPLDGFILIRSASQDFPSSAEEHISVKYDLKTKEIKSAVIEIFHIDLLGLEHELGHALGYKHIYKKGNIMYSNMNSIGFNDEGLSKKQ